MNRSSLLREPLLHFAVLGLLIFAVDAYLRWQADERHVIRLDAGVEKSLVSLFREGQGREPTEAEVSMLVHRWLQNEVYYREALTMGLDKGDEMIHSRLILKMREVVLNNIVVSPPSEEELRAWFEANRSRYEVPERYDFSQALVAGDAGAREAAEKALPASDGEPVAAPYADQLRSYGERSRENIADMFGESFAVALLAERAPQWRAVQSPLGWHVVRLDAVHPAVPATYETIKANVRADWEGMQKTAAAFEAIREMRKRYTVTGPGMKYLEIQPAEVPNPADALEAAPTVATAKPGQPS
ncbi:MULTISPECIES: peptidylprolyl isomerase [Rhodomicrobium]|uniref:peptidylprolyl isomerase n=1 Tax=Rhodomicrobium TaxID=1068 RepID=UPI000B4B1C0A|nr:MULTISPECIES: peptidylprolyl isomerase [Rhodomicrobium]